MKLRYYLLALLLVPTFGTISGAQPPDGGEKQGRTSRDIDKTKDGGIDEDIEIMRRILVGRLSGHDQYVGGNQSAAMNLLRNANNVAARPEPHQPNHPTYGLYDVNSYPTTRSMATTVEGVHLGDKGVWFTITMPATQRNPWPTTPAAPTKTVSDWDRARQQLRGETPEPAAKTEAPQPTPSDIIMAVLAENGKNLRVKNNEDVIVVVTFRNPATAQNNPIVAIPSYTKADFTSATPDQKPLTTAQNSPGADPLGHGKSARDFLLLGDLHLRQQQHTQALEAFRQALKLEPNGDPKQLAETFRKLAETKLHLGQLDEAKAMIESAVEWEKKARVPNAAEKPKTDQAAPAAPRWPAKLIIMTNKQTLDEVGAGRISLEEFRKKVKFGMESPPVAK